MGFLVAGGILLLIGLAAGFKGGSRRVVGPALAFILACLMVSAWVLCSWVLAIDPGRDTGIVPLPAPWSSVLPALALGLLFALPTSLGGFLGLSACDFMTRRFSRWIRLVGYAIVVGALVAIAPWVFGVTFD